MQKSHSENSFCIPSDIHFRFATKIFAVTRSLSLSNKGLETKEAETVGDILYLAHIHYYIASGSASADHHGGFTAAFGRDAAGSR